MTHASDVTQFCPCCVELSLEVKALKGERKIYPVSVRPARRSNYLVHSKHGGRWQSLFDGDYWRSHEGVAFTPDYWEELPKFDERFVVGGDEQ